VLGGAACSEEDRWPGGDVFELHGFFLRKRWKAWLAGGNKGRAGRQTVSSAAFRALREGRETEQADQETPRVIATNTGTAWKIPVVCTSQTASSA
jgi:hypothetical protein